MKNFILFICFYLFCSNLEAALFPEKIYVGDNKEVYNYFLTITEISDKEHVKEKINRKNFLFKNNLNFILVVEIPPSLSVKDQTSIITKIRELDSILQYLDYKHNVRVNGILDKNISSYRIHIYYN